MRTALWPLTLVLVSPAIAHAYVDPTGGGFLLQLLLAGITGFFLVAKLFGRRLLSKIREVFRPKR